MIWREPAKNRRLLGIACLLAAWTGTPSCYGQNDSKVPRNRESGRELALPDFRPQPMLKTTQHLREHARFPVVDAHTHFGRRLRHSPEQLEGYVKVMDRNRIAVCASLDAQLGDGLEEHTDYLWTRYRDRFVVFTNIDWVGDGKPEDPGSWDCHRPDFARRIARLLQQARDRGASGLKLFKQFGLSYRNPDGSLIKIDDPRWDPIWRACGELKMPVIMHTADPAAFFLPIDEKNERWEELSRHPDWSFYGEKYPSREELLAARNRVVARHGRTTFIGAHLANNAEDLQTVGQWLDRYPNLYVETASRIGELGRQPYTARRFFLRYQDRILFGTDGPWPETRVRLYWRFLETRDEYFPYSEKPFPPQGFWRIYGIGLPEDVLKKVYFQNAARIIPGLKDRLARWDEDGGS